MEMVLHEATNGHGTTEKSESASATQVPRTYVQAENGNRATKFSRLPETDPVDMQFTDITYTATMGNIFTKREKKEILHKVNGRFPAGQLIAIMGPSGAGKSTLLDVLSGYRINGVGGTVNINGRPRNLKAFRKMSCYITQDDRLQPLLTVRENMLIAADLKLESNVTRKQKLSIINEILETLGLSRTKNTKASGLSGGQKKRLSIALELINNPMILFLDEPTTGLDSSTCMQCVKLLQFLARQGRTIVCTIHQPSASLFSLFDQVYVLAAGNCLYQGDTNKLVPFLEDVGFPCPEYHNPADYVIELACEEYGKDKVLSMIKATGNGTDYKYLKDSEKLPIIQQPIDDDYDDDDEDGLQATSSFNQLKVLMRRGYIKTKRDTTLTYMRLIVNALVGLMLGSVYWQAGQDGSKVLDNYNLLFSILMHHMMSTMMLTILTFPSEMSILVKEHFNRWYSLKMYYTSVTLVDIPISVLSCAIFTIIVYYMTGQPMEYERLAMFFIATLLVVFVAQSFGLVIGAFFDVVNGTFLGPTLSVPVMMFAGFGVSIRDLPPYLHWGSYVSYLRYGLEGVVAAVYGLNRGIIECPDDKYCHYKYPKKFLEDVAVRADQFDNDVLALLLTLFFLRIGAYVVLRCKLLALR